MGSQSEGGLAQIQVVYFQDNPKKQEGERGERKANIMKWMLLATGAQPRALRSIPQKGRRREQLFTRSVLFCLPVVESCLGAGRQLPHPPASLTSATFSTGKTPVWLAPRALVPGGSEIL